MAIQTGLAQRPAAAVAAARSGGLFQPGFEDFHLGFEDLRLGFGFTASLLGFLLPDFRSFSIS